MCDGGNGKLFTNLKFDAAGSNMVEEQYEWQAKL